VTFGARILFAMVTILVVTVLGSMVAAERWLRASIESTLANEMQREARLLAAALPRDPTELAGAARHLAALGNRRMTIIDSTGRVLGDSEFDDESLALLDNHLGRPEIAEALRAGHGVAKRYSNSTNRDELKVAVRAWPGVVRISAAMAEVDTVVLEAQRGVLVAAFVALLLGVALAWFGGREVSRPLAELAESARGVAGGRSPAYPATTVPEIRQLIRAFRAMRDELALRMEDLVRRRDETTAIVESMVEGVAAVDARGQIVYCNRALRRLLGYDEDATLPSLRELFRAPESREVVDVVLGGQAVLGREVSFEDRVALITARPLPDRGAVICVHDITDLRRLETVRRDFVANVSHELKTPLTSIVGYADILMSDRPDPDTQARFLSVIRNNANRMQHLVDDLLDLARLESGAWRPSVEPVDPREAGKAAWAEFAEQARAAGVAFDVTVASGVTLYADPESLDRMLANLFDNALRHTPAGGRIRFDAQPAEGGTAIAVSDTGAGIPADHLPRVFERFYRVDPARSRSQGGTGLGLSIVKHAVEAHGGRVDLTSAVGRGTTVRLFFPLPRSA
jgi:two-component system, OmpR family, phosphate regulon sensor histidine kinase PhoR